MNLQNLTDEQLQDSFENAVRVERDAITNVLKHLAEVNRRRLFSKFKYQSLKDYAVKKLGYTDNEANLRISAMYIFSDFPQIEEKINSGAVTLSNMSLAQRHFRHEKKIREESMSSEEKITVLKEIENLSSRDVIKVLAKKSSQPETLFAESITPINDTFSNAQMPFDQALIDKIEKSKGALAHKLPNATYLELFHEAFDALLEKQAKNFAQQRRRVKNPSVRRQVFIRDGGKCQNCGSQHAVEQDHIIPRAKGGADTLENSRLLCRSCNQRAAIEQFGQHKMDKFLGEKSSAHSPNFANSIAPLPCMNIAEITHVINMYQLNHKTRDLLI